MEFVLIVFWLLAGPIVGGLCGRARGREAFGFVLGLLLGPIGWLIVLGSQDARRRCPECNGPIEQDVNRCLHCGSVLAQRKREDKQPQSQTANLSRCLACNSVISSALDSCPQCGVSFAPELPVVRIPDHFKRCPCNHCDVMIEFPGEGLGQIVTCPKCGMETVLFDPTLRAEPL